MLCNKNEEILQELNQKVTQNVHFYAFYYLLNSTEKKIKSFYILKHDFFLSLMLQNFNS